MSRTFVHRPVTSYHHWQMGGWDDEYEKHYNTREHNTKRWSRRKIRHALIDEDMKWLYNAIAERGRNSQIARNKYW